jgi:hypothetical protein
VIPLASKPLHSVLKLGHEGASLGAAPAVRIRLVRHPVHLPLLLDPYGFEVLAPLREKGTSRRRGRGAWRGQIITQGA